jgi:hypothetical protein
MLPNDTAFPAQVKASAVDTAGLTPLKNESTAEITEVAEFSWICLKNSQGFENLIIF